MVIVVMFGGGKLVGLSQRLPGLRDIRSAEAKHVNWCVILTA